VDHIVIEGTSPWAGRYEFDLSESIESLTLREWGWIKKLGGYLPGTIQEGLLGADAELIGTFACIALYRHRKIEKDRVPEVFEQLIDSPFTSVKVEFGEQAEESDRTPTQATSSNGSPVSSGLVSPTSSVSSDESPTAVGMPALDTSGSDPPISGS
jgi:hypothetical protein